MPKTVISIGRSVRSHERRYRDGKQGSNFIESQLRSKFSVDDSFLDFDDIVDIIIRVSSGDVYCSLWDSHCCNSTYHYRNCWKACIL